ncbi:hypothetical protein VTJ04DRAFT_8889 [Mycothermus thermophilus]|uniref:uncharacterized protein n=1 Tax=Humicola insolens TaxID=85995 RepID=UPI003742ECA9
MTLFRSCPLHYKSTRPSTTTNSAAVIWGLFPYNIQRAQEAFFVHHEPRSELDHIAINPPLYGICSVHLAALPPSILVARTSPTRRQCPAVDSQLKARPQPTGQYILDTLSFQASNLLSVPSPVTPDSSYLGPLPSPYLAPPFPIPSPCHQKYK